MIFNYGITRARKVFEMSLERSRQHKFELVSFIGIAAAVPEVGGSQR